MKAICIIPAKGVSTRIPGKNWKLFHGKPLIAYSILTALESGMFEGVYVSTDSAKIAAIARLYGAQVIERHPHLTEDHVGTQEVVRHALAHVHEHVDLVCCIYPTAPMLTVHDLIRGRAAMNRSDTLFAFSVGTHPLSDAGQFYWSRPWAMVDNKLFDQHSAMIPIDQNRVMDINTLADFHAAEKMYAEWKGIQ